MKAPASALLFSAVFLGVMTFAQTSKACEAPTEPSIPNADTAVTAEMVKAQNDVKQYMTDAQNYLQCVRNDTQHNRMVSRMEEIAAEFNQTVRAFKERMSKV